jgi:hypothetical protein
MLYQKKNIAVNPAVDVGVPGPLPACLVGSLSPEALADLSWVSAEIAQAEGLVGMGFFAYTPPAPQAFMPKIDFLRLFKVVETVAILEAVKTVPAVAVYQYRLDNADRISLQDQDVQNGVPMLEFAGLIGPGRAAQILAGVAVND